MAHLEHERRRRLDDEEREEIDHDSEHGGGGKHGWVGQNDLPGPGGNHGLSLGTRNMNEGQECA